jgi:hypothetical protein
MNARQLAKACNRTIGTLNTWAQRGHFSGVTISKKRNPRAYSEQQAAAIIVFSDLEKLSFSPEERKQISENHVTRIKLGSITVTIDREDVMKRVKDAADS